jgi:UDP-N-acetylglucosamine 2-epimerase (non-hydrolysing)
MADLHFVPTEQALKNLVDEKISVENVYLTGNTVIDALLYTQTKINENPSKYKKETPWRANGNPFILITGHRRENFGQGFENICNAIQALSTKYPNYNFVFPVHLNPNVQQPVQGILKNHSNIFLVDPLDYVEFTALLTECLFVLTDSGGIQEEAPSLGKPVLVMRDTTERQEAVTAGVAILVGTDIEKIITEASNLIENKEAYNKMSKAQNPFGQGNSAKQIVDITLRYFGTK